MLAIKEWKSKYPDSSVVAETRTTARHAEFISMGVTPVLRSDRCEANDKTARYVLISLPPSSNKEDYVGEVSDACRVWAGPLGQGHMVFTSSSAVYGDSNGNTVDEVFRLDTRSERSTKLVIIFFLFCTGSIFMQLYYCRPRLCITATYASVFLKKKYEKMSSLYIILFRLRTTCIIDINTNIFFPQANSSRRDSS